MWSDGDDCDTGESGGCGVMVGVMVMIVIQVRVEDVG